MVTKRKKWILLQKNSDVSKEKPESDMFYIYIYIYIHTHRLHSFLFFFTLKKIKNNKLRDNDWHIYVCIGVVQTRFLFHTNCLWVFWQSPNDPSPHIYPFLALRYQIDWRLLGMETTTCSFHINVLSSFQVVGPK